MAEEMVTVKFINSIADSGTLSFTTGEIVELPRSIAKNYLGMKYEDGSPKLCVEIGRNTCPHCGGELEPRTPPGLESATVAHAPRRRG